MNKILEIVKDTDKNYAPYYDMIPNLIKERKYSSGIEIGVFCGGHAESILKTGVVLIGIDPYELYLPGMPLMDTQEDFDELYSYVMLRLNKYNYSHMRMDSDMAFSYIINKHDFVFIDGLHTYEQVKKDLNNYGSLIRKGGVICGHDIDHPYFPDVTDAIEEFAKEHNATIVRKELHAWYINKTW